MQTEQTLDKPVTLSTGLRHFLHREDGAVLPIVALALVPLLGVAALAVDVPRGFLGRSELQAAADSAALAGAAIRRNHAAAEREARAYLHNNAPGWTRDIDAGTRIEIGTWDNASGFRTVPAGADFDSVRVSVAMRETGGEGIATTFARLMGRNNLDVGASATATRSSAAAPWDIVIAQDVSGSFTQALPQANLANQLLLRCIAGQKGRSYTGFAVFGGRAASLGQPIASDGGIDDLDQDNDDPQKPGEQALRDLYKEIGNIGPGYGNTSTSTDIGAGLREATRLLESVPPAERARKRAIVLVGDGEPMCDPALGTCSSNQQLRNEAVAAANAADARGISIFPIFLNPDNFGGPTGFVQNSGFLKSLVRRDGSYHETVDPTRLPTITAAICGQITPPLRLVR